jgi:hypothetical protein
MEPDNRERLDDLLDDKWLDAALKQFGASEPRPGLEGRVLASIRSKRERATVRPWTRWAALAFAAGMLLISAAAFLMRPNAVTPVSVNDHHTIPIVREGTERTDRLHRGTRSARSGKAAQTVAQVSRPQSGVATPRPEQFPSPLPLSEQEQILANYVTQFPHQALLMARAQTDLLREELIERQEASPKDGTTEDSEQQNQ